MCACALVRYCAFGEREKERERKWFLFPALIHVVRFWFVALCCVEIHVRVVFPLLPYLLKLGMERERGPRKDEKRNISEEVSTTLVVYFLAKMV